MDIRTLVPFSALVVVLALQAPVQAEVRIPAPEETPPAEPDAVYYEAVDIKAIHSSTSAAITIGAASFGSHDDEDLFVALTFGYAKTFSNSVQVMAPVALPDGVEILGLYLYAYDNSLTQLVAAYLVRQEFGNAGQGQTMAGTSTISEWPFVQVASDQTVENGVVNNDLYQYHVWAEIGGDQQRLYAIRIVYDDAVATATSGIVSTRSTQARGFPNPFGDRTSVQFLLPSPQPVNVRVYDSAGRLVRTLLSGPLGSGRHDLSWDGRDGSGQAVSNGIYYLRVTDDQYELATKLVRLK